MGADRTRDTGRTTRGALRGRRRSRGLSSELIRSATTETYRAWLARYGRLPDERLRTEIGVREVKSPNPGYCYLCAGWVRDRVVGGKLYLWAPERVSEAA